MRMQTGAGAPARMMPFMIGDVAPAIVDELQGDIEVRVAKQRDDRLEVVPLRCR